MIIVVRICWAKPASSDFVSRAPVRFVEPAFLGIVHPDEYKLGSPKDPCTQTVYALVLILYRDY